MNKEISIPLEKANVTLRNDGILHIHLNAGSDIHIEDARQIFETMGKIGKGRKFPVLIDAGEFVQVDKDVQKFSASIEGNIYTIADAIAYCSLGQKLVAGFYIRRNDPVIPTKMFSGKAPAIEWLKCFLKTES
ncbi:MAG TPA: hypothetical protein VK177_16780 [Flavobacteriales bacterium]|nr:hypothetical protein [Flavobacteriales bacterium]